MFTGRRILVSTSFPAALAALAVLAALAGCGQRGPLYLPEQGAAAPPAAASIAQPATPAAPVDPASDPSLVSPSRSRP
ncbi:hypothetical protein GCM10027019_10500 [Melaminivora jejuensis]|uniref:LPS translocon maturation chaperone LptM n=1 Tax=Melaminivora jejuensis TaxID=1267217 RepID=UPI001AE07E96|nr:lipoprotein [Melaminivora jejuensis]UHJ64368.1 lipoprotein [Melaminivora jejuensis]